MELQDIIGNAVGSFFFGLYLGISGVCDSNREKIEDLEANLTKEEMESNGLSYDKLKKIKRNSRKINLLLPFAVGGAYSLISEITTESSMTDSMIFAVPSAYIGKIAGSAVRKLTRRKHIRDLEVARRIKDDPEHALDYIPLDRKKIIEFSLSEIERKIIEGEPIEDKEFLNRMYYGVMAAEDKAYSPVLREWVLGKFKDVCRTATLQRELTDFYEGDEQMSVAILGKPKNTSIIVYEREGKNFRTYNVSLDDFRMIEQEGVSVIIEGSVPQLQLEKELEWNGDYKSLAMNLIERRPSHTIVLLRSPKGLPESIKTEMVAGTFSSAFVAAYSKMMSDGENPGN